MQIISVVNQKGGVGKTFTSVNIAIGLAWRGYRVLVLDLDPQGSLSISLGLENPDSENLTVSTIFQHMKNREEFDPMECILKHPEGIHYIPANIDLVSTEIDLVSAWNREYLLGKFLDKLENDYDIVLIDCSPSLGLVTMNALACTHQVVIPIQAQYLSVKGMEQLLRTIGGVQEEFNGDLVISGVLVTMANTRTREYKETYTSLIEKYGGKIPIFETIIPHSTKAAETSKLGKSIFAHDPNGKISLAYADLITEMVGEEEAEEEMDEPERGVG